MRSHSPLRRAPGALRRAAGALRRAAGALRRALGALVLAASFVTVAAPAPALAAAPQPLPGYQPAFVTERDGAVWEDCIWASAAMLLDKWTTGLATVDRERLRTLSGDHAGGSHLGDVRRAFGELGMHLPTSPYGGESITWSGLLKRLGDGGGAILLGDYGRLPERYGRWDKTFWSRDGDGDDHALYLDRYDRRTGRILVMDPLAPAGWAGEWVPVAGLKAYAWRTASGSLWAAMTPAALAAPFDGVALGQPTATADSSALRVGWPIEQAPRGWAYGGSSVTAEITAVTDADPTDQVVQALPAGQAAGQAAGQVAGQAAGQAVLPLPAPAADVAGGLLTAAIPLPTAPGIYRVTVALADLRFGRLVAAAGPFSLYVPGRRAASYVVHGPSSVAAGDVASFSVTVTNAGAATWVDPPLVAWLPLEQQRSRNTRLTGTWVRGPLAAGAVPSPVKAPVPVDLGPLHLEAGDARSVDALIRAPIDPGHWRFVIDVVDDEIGSLALSGTAPGVILVEVLPAGQSPTPGG